MCNPPTKTKSIQVKKVAALDLVQAGKRNIKAVAKGGQGMPVEEKASALLLTAAGVPSEELAQSASALEVLGEHLINPLHEELAGSFRAALGL